MMKNKFKFEWFTQVGQLYILPTIRVTYDLGLYGWYTIDIAWFNKGLSLNIFVNEDWTDIP